MSQWPEIVIVLLVPLRIAVLSVVAWLRSRMADVDEIDEELDEANGENDQPDGDFK